MLPKIDTGAIVIRITTNVSQSGSTAMARLGLFKGDKQENSFISLE